MNKTKKSLAAVILAGGKGLRLKSITNGHQKCIQKFNGRPFLIHLLDQLTFLNIRRVYIMAGFKSIEVKTAIDLYKKTHDLKITVLEEKKPLGTGGCLKLLNKKTIENDLLIINGDTYFDIKSQIFISSLSNYHKGGQNTLFFLGQSSSDEGSVSVIEKQKEHVIFKKENLATISRIKAQKCYSGWLIMQSRILKYFPTGSYDFEEIFMDIQTKTEIKSQVIEIDAYFYDFGTPNRYKQLSNFIKNSLIMDDNKFIRES